MMNDFLENEVESQHLVSEVTPEHLMWRRVMDSEDGASVLREILEACCLFKPSYVRGDVYETAFREGRRNLGLWLLGKMGDADQRRTAEILNTPDERNGRNAKHADRRNDDPGY